MNMIMIILTKKSQNPLQKNLAKKASETKKKKPKTSASKKPKAKKVSKK